MPDPRILIGVSVNFFALSIGQRTTAAPPSDRGAQSNMPSGVATGGALRTISMDISLLYCACGFKEPFLWFFTATAARCSLVVP